MSEERHPEGKTLLEKELQIISEWEIEQNDMWFWEKIMRLPFALLDKITPKKVHEYLGKILDEVGSYIQYGGDYLISEKTLLKKLAERSTPPVNQPFTIADVGQLPIETMNTFAQELIQSRKSYATLHGATTGIGGIFTLAIDIPTILGMSLKILQEMAITYGYQPSDKKERIFIVKCLQFASSDMIGKKALLKDLSHYHVGNQERESISQLNGWREVIETYRDHYGWKKLFQLVPILGIIFGAFINRSTIEEVAEVGHMLYRKRRVLEKLAAITPDSDDPQQLGGDTTPQISS